MGYVGFVRKFPGRIELLVPMDSLHRRALRSTRSSEACPLCMYLYHPVKQPQNQSMIILVQFLRATVVLRESEPNETIYGPVP